MSLQVSRKSYYERHTRNYILQMSKEKTFYCCLDITRFTLDSCVSHAILSCITFADIISYTLYHDIVCYNVQQYIILCA